MTELDEVVRERRWTRLFLRDKPVPRELLDEALSLAMRAPSNSNVQPWRVFIASGPRRDRLVEALLEAASVELPVTTGLPEHFIPRRQELGALVYGSMGIARHDVEARRLAQLRNWEFFRAPVGAVVCMHRDLGLVDSLGVGMFLQTLVLALTERGLGTCVQVSIDRGLPGDTAGSARHTGRADRLVRPGDRLSRPRLPGQQPRSTA